MFLYFVVLEWKKFSVFFSDERYVSALNGMFSVFFGIHMCFSRFCTTFFKNI